MRRRVWSKWLPVWAVAMGAWATLAQAQGLTVTDGLMVHIEADVGVGTTGVERYVTNWADQASAGGAQDFATVAPTSAWRPTHVGEATPNGKSAVRFKRHGSTRLRSGADPDWDSPSMTWVLALRPTMPDTYEFFRVVTTESTHAARRTVYDNGVKKYYGGTRDTAARYESMIATNTLGSLPKEWMIMSTVHDDAAQTVQFWITDLSNTLHTATAVANAGVWTGHSETLLGNTSGSELLGFDLAALLVYTNALGATDRLAVEAYLYDKYIRLPPSGTVVLIR